MTKPASVTGGCQARSRQAIMASKWVLSCASVAVATVIGDVGQRTGAGTFCA